MTTATRNLLKTIKGEKIEVAAGEERNVNSPTGFSNFGIAAFLIANGKVVGPVVGGLPGGKQHQVASEYAAGKTSDKVRSAFPVDLDVFADPDGRPEMVRVVARMSGIEVGYADSVRESLVS